MRSVEVCPGEAAFNCLTVYNKTTVQYSYIRRRLEPLLTRRYLQGDKQLIILTILFPAHSTAPTAAQSAMDFQLKLRNPLSSVWTSVSALEFGDVTFISAEVHGYDNVADDEGVIQTLHTHTHSS